MKCEFILFYFILRLLHVILHHFLYQPVHCLRAKIQALSAHPILF